jgi:hypothetical protein
MAESLISQQSARWRKSTSACHSPLSNTAPVGIGGLIGRAALMDEGSSLAGYPEGTLPRRFQAPEVQSLRELRCCAILRR